MLVCGDYHHLQAASVALSFDSWLLQCNFLAVFAGALAPGNVQCEGTGAATQA
jgi:hypothetical protein